MTDGGIPEAVSTRPLDQLRQRLEQLDRVALADQPSVFEQLNDALVAELAALEQPRDGHAPDAATA